MTQSVKNCGKLAIAGLVLSYFIGLIGLVVMVIGLGGMVYWQIKGK